MSAGLLIEEYLEELAAPKLGRFLVKIRRYVHKVNPSMQQQMSQEHIKMFGQTLRQMKKVGAKNMTEYLNKEIRTTVAGLKQTTWGAAQNSQLAKLNAMAKFRQMIPKFERYQKISVKYAQQLKKGSKSPEIPNLKRTRDTLHKELSNAAQKPFSHSAPEVLTWKQPGASGRLAFQTA